MKGKKGKFLDWLGSKICFRFSGTIFSAKLDKNLKEEKGEGMFRRYLGFFWVGSNCFGLLRFLGNECNAA